MGNQEKTCCHRTKNPSHGIQGINGPQITAHLLLPGLVNHGCQGYGHSHEETRHRNHEKHLLDQEHKIRDTSADRFGLNSKWEDKGAEAYSHFYQRKGEQGIFQPFDERGEREAPNGDSREEAHENDGERVHRIVHHQDKQTCPEDFIGECTEPGKCQARQNQEYLRFRGLVLAGSDKGEPAFWFPVMGVGALPSV